MSGIESAGDMVTGGMVARAIEPRHGEGGSAHAGDCANCGTKLSGQFCHRCGQNAHVHRSLGGIGHELAHGVFHFEGKIWRTLPMLFFKPGQLTRRYVHGERARFVTPLALFLFAVFLTFFVFETVGGPFGGGRNGLSSSVDFTQAVQEADADVARYERLLDDARKAKRETTAIEQKLSEARSDRTGLLEARALIDGRESMNFDKVTVKSSSGWIEQRYAEAKKNPKLLLYKLQNSAYKYAWALILLSLPWMFLAFPFKRGVHLYDHTVFITYSLSWVMLLLIVVSLITHTPIGAAASALLLLFPVHLFAQVKGAYVLGWWGATWRTALLLWGALISLVIFAVLLLVLGVSG